MKILKILAAVVALLLIAAIGVFFLKPGLDSIGATLDLDGSGDLTVDELPPLVRRDLPNVDRNGDGRVGPAELRIHLLRQILASREPVAAPDYEGELTFSDLPAYVGAAAAAGDFQSGVLMLGYRGETIYRLSFGDLTPTTQVPIASGSKWLTAAVIGALADRGIMEINTPLSYWSPEIPETHGEMTIAQMMAHVSGMDGRLGLVSGASLEADANKLLAKPLAAPPGNQFRYGSASMMVAARLAEIQTGLPWRRIANEALFEPLAMRQTAYANPIRPLDYGLETSPEVAGGVHSTAADYMTFLAMVARAGLAPDGKRILSLATLREMETARSMGAKRVGVPPAVNHEFEYAMGVWCERWTDEGVCTLMHSQGAFGTRPFLDRETGIYGIFLIVEDGAKLRNIIQRVREVAFDTAINELGLAPLTVGQTGSNTGH